MLILRQISPSTTTDDEVAAIMAAVTCVVEGQEQAPEAVQEPRTSAWKRASLLESSGRAPRLTTKIVAQAKSKPWTLTTLPKLISLSFVGMISTSMLMGASASAQEAPPMAPPAVANDSKQMPPAAPPLNRSRGNQVRSLSNAGELQLPPILRPPIPQIDSPGSSASDSGTAQQSDDSAENAPWMMRGQTTLRVAIGLDTTNTSIGLPDGATLKDARNGETLAQLPPQSQWQVAVRSPGGLTQLCFSGKTTNRTRNQVLLARQDHYRNVAFAPSTAPSMANLVPLPGSQAPQFWLPIKRNTNIPTNNNRAYVLVPPPDGEFAVGGKVYRGVLLVKPRPITPGHDQSLNLINCVEIEDYLLSVVPAEMPSSWPLEALKAQAVAARSYAIANIGKHEADGYDVKANTEDQVYSGVAGESINSNKAVAQTSGQVLKYAGNVVSAYFHSTSGGYTELADNVWSRPLPYLKAVPDYDDDSPYFAWTRSFDISSAEQALTRNNKNVGSLLSLMPVARGISPRVRFLLATGTDRTLLISGEEARKIFALPSSCFNVGNAPQAYVFAGRGFGHGLGMSQWGAKKLAEAGYSARQILTYYYKDVTVERF